MKQFKSTIIPTLLLVVSGLLMTSCDDDQETAMMLWGTWEGQLSTDFYSNRWGTYGSSYYTVWHFEGKPGSRQGDGWEVDYVRGQRYAQRFRWQVMDNGTTVRLVYDGKWEDEYIYNFYLSDDYFSGYIDSNNGQQSHFQLYKVDDNGYDFDYEWDYYAKKPLPAKKTDSHE